MSFTHLHVHSEYSLLDGACQIEPMLDKIKSMGQNSVAITDHGVMYGALDFYQAAVKRGIKPIIGCEVYVAPRTRFDKVHGLDSERYHLILLCKNETGYKNLIKIVSESFVNGFYIKPRVDFDLLAEHSDGLIALSGCLFGEVSQLLLKDDYANAKATALKYNDAFGKENYFIEIQNHGLNEQLQIRDLLLKLSRETDIPLVATNDAHYINKDDNILQKILICIQTNHILGEETGLDFCTDEFYLKSENEMLDAFSFCPHAVYNTQKISDRCNFDFEFGNTKLPHFDIPDGSDHIEYFNALCRKGLYKRYGDKPAQSYIDRMNYELEIINSMGYTDYYLIVYDFIHYAKSQGIPVGPGRGSGAASICAYCIGITGIDPMKYNLLFERFLNPERVSMPDFDIDFCYERRSEVIDYVIRKYGADHVAQIVTFGTMAAKQAIRDVGRVMGISYTSVDKISKLIPFELNITISKALEESAELRALYNNDSTAKEILDLSMKVEGMPRHASTHAAGIVITADPVDSYVPLATNDEAVVTQFTMKGLEKLGLLKMDFLGLRTLTVINDTEKSVRIINPSFSVEKIDLNDRETYNMFSAGLTDGVFQFESAGMKRILTQLNPQSLEDLIAVIALYRPGPMESIPKYIKNKKNPSEIHYNIPKLKSILDVTYGCMVYQEQVMQICREIAGYSYGRADIVRRAMAKKQHDVMLKERDYFINGITDEKGNIICEGALKRGVPSKYAEELFDNMISFASYAFNKAHATAYALVSYQTAYLKCHYPNEFFAALMTSFMDNPGKVAGYIEECEKLKIKIYPPHVNISEAGFSAGSEGIVFCLAAVKNIGKGFIANVISERQLNGKFTDFYDFCKRMYGKSFNRRAVESLIKCGALDGLGANRKQMLQSIDSIIDGLELQTRNNIEGQLAFGDLGEENSELSDNKGFSYPDVDEFDVQTLLAFEKEVTGIYISGHPLKQYEKAAQDLKCNNINDILNSDYNINDACEVTLLAIVSSVKKKITKNNKTMAFITVEDNYGSIEALIFPQIYEKFSYLLTEGNIIILHGKISLNDDAPPSIIAEALEKVPESLSSETAKTDTGTDKPKGLFLRFDAGVSPQVNICDNLISIFDGKEPVYYYYASDKKYIKKNLCDVNDVLIKELIKILGKDNVIFNK